jgi:Carbohydrate esterase 2 N-terminal/GDSL-like Lipase/Acylhydrolase family
MKLHVGSLAAATAIFVSLYACSSDPSADAQDGGGLPPPGEDGGSGGDASAPDALTDGQGNPDGATDATIDAPVDAGPPAVRYVGRFFDPASAGGEKSAVAWPGAQIIARFSGTADVKATFSDVALFDPSYGANRWEVFIDGVSKTTIQLDRTQPTTYTLASGLALTPHTVELYKLTEGSVGTSRFLGFDFSGGVLLSPPPASTRHMQFLGDSSSNGYGVDGAPGCMFSAATENERKSYGALIAHDLLADHHNLSASGKGLYWNYYRPDTDIFSVIYQRSGVSTGSAPLWSAADYTPDVVWITLGGNDYEGPQPPDPPPAGAFETKYTQIVTTIRTQHPSAHIFCSVAPSLSNVFPAGYNAYTNVKTGAQNVVSGRAAAGDSKVYFFEFTRSAMDGSDTTACDGHVNGAKHRAMADEAIVLIKAKTGW